MSDRIYRASRTSASSASRQLQSAPRPAHQPTIALNCMAVKIVDPASYKFYVFWYLFSKWANQIVSQNFKNDREKRKQEGKIGEDRFLKGPL